MRGRWRMLGSAVAAALLLGSTLWAQNPFGADRYQAMFADGTRWTGNQLVGWERADGAPMLDGRVLLLPGNPLVWLRDQRLRPESPPAAFVELVGGDRLPGVTLRWNGVTSVGYESIPATFSVKPSIDLHRPAASPLEEVHVLDRFVRRIVWQRREIDRYEPNRLFFRDGRSLAYRAMRVEREEVHLLLEDGNRRVSFAEIAELHFPPLDVWSAYLDELAALSPDVRVPLLQLVTTTGLIATGSLERFAATVQGNPREAERWVHAVQPAWSLELLWVRCDSVWLRKLHHPGELPLSRLVPEIHRAAQGLARDGWQPQVNANVLGGNLASGEGEFGWGFGTQGPLELRFPLPDLAVGFRSRVGLDKLAGGGGCVKVRVLLGEKTPPLYESPHLVGSEKAVDTGPLALAAGERRTLILQTDMAHNGRPAGADPLDIRDLVDWFDPVLKLDEEQLRAECRRRLGQQIPAWEGWEVIVEEAGDYQFASFLDDYDNTRPAAFRTSVHAGNKNLTLRRTLDVTPQTHYLVAAPYVLRGGLPPHRVEVRVDGETVAEYTVPERRRDRETPAPLLVSLAAYRGHKIKLEVVQFAGPAAVDWRAIRISEQLPTLFQLFDDAGQFTALGPEDPPLKFVDEEPQSGAQSARVERGGRFRLALTGDRVHIRQNPLWGEYRYLRFAFRKFGQGRICLELEHEKSLEKAVRYDAGTGAPCYGEAKRVWALDLPKEWIVMTVDLYQDFGPLDLQALVLGVPDGEYALFDQVYLARTEADFDLIPAALTPEAANRKARTELAKPVLDKALPAVVALDFGGRWGTGALISADGEIVTAGHLVLAADRDVTVYLADGRKLAGKTRGVNRNGDCGLVKIVEGSGFPHLEFGATGDLPPARLYLGVAHLPGYESGKRPEAHITNLQQAFREFLWTTFALNSYHSGGPLLDAEGKLLGVQSRQSRFGGFLYLKAELIRDTLERMRRGEVWGEWYAGTGPIMGLDVEASRSGCVVKRVTPNSASEKAGLQPADVITKVAGRSVVSLDDVSAVLADKDPGAKVILDVARDGKTLQIEVELMPRVP